MDYKILAERLKCPNISQCPFTEHEMSCMKCQHNIYEEAATAITDLLARAEAAEEDRDRMREAMKPNCLLCDSMHENGNCTEVGGFCTAVPAAHCPLIPRLRNKLAEVEARAEKAERERDAAVADLRLASDCRTCGNVSPWCIENPDKCKGWEWRGRKEE